jgi:hypothetical protein
MKKKIVYFYIAFFCLNQLQGSWWSNIKEQFNIYYNERNNLLLIITNNCILIKNNCVNQIANYTKWILSPFIQNVEEETNNFLLIHLRNKEIKKNNFII